MIVIPKESQCNKCKGLGIKNNLSIAYTVELFSNSSVSKRHILWKRGHRDGLCYFCEGTGIKVQSGENIEDIMAYLELKSSA